MITSRVPSRKTRPPSAELMVAAWTSSLPSGARTTEPSSLRTVPDCTSMRASAEPTEASNSKAACPRAIAVRPLEKASFLMLRVEAMKADASTCEPGLKTMPLALMR